MASSCRPSAFLFITFILHFMLLATHVSAKSSVNYEHNDLVSHNLIQCLTKHHNAISASSYTPKNSSFHKVLNWRGNNLRYQKPDTWKPILIVIPEEESHIPAIVRCARTNNVKIRTRSGGHDFEGVSFTAPFGTPFIILDMYKLNQVDIDIEDETGWVQSGATLGEIYYKIAEKSNVHAFPAGICPTVGAGGHFSGGGYGTLMRMYGLSVDNIVDARIVDAEGRVLDKESMGQDLFWAIRGGGGSSFGVILAWKIKLVRVPPKVTVFNVEKDILAPGVNHILYRWQIVSPKLPKEIFLRVESQVYTNPDNPDGNITAKASFLALFLGDAQSLVRIMQTKFPELGLKAEDCKEMPWIDSVLFYHHFPENTPRETLLDYDSRTSPAYRKVKGDFVKRPIPEAELLTMWKKVAEFGFLYMEWSPYGGRMDEIGESEVPYPHRKGNLYSVFYDIIWFNDSFTNYFMDKSRELYQLMEPYVSDSPRESLLNYLDLDLETPGQKYFADNFMKLVMVKTRVDHTDFFSHQQSIPTLYKLLENKDLLRQHTSF